MTCQRCGGWGIQNPHTYRVTPCRCQMNAILEAAYSAHVKEGIKPEEQKLLDRLK